MPRIATIRRWLGILPIILGLVVGANATAQMTMVSSLDQPMRNVDPVATDSWIADKFTTSDSSGGFDLTSATIQFSAADVDDGNYFAAIYTDDSDVPGVQIGSALSGTLFPATAGRYIFTTSGIHLNANTSYWLVEGVTTGDSVYNPDYEIATPSITDVWTITGRYTFSADAAATWAPVNADGPVMYSLQAQAVPEPAEFGLIGGVVGLMAVFASRRRWKK